MCLVDDSLLGVGRGPISNMDHITYTYRGVFLSSLTQLYQLTDHAVLPIKYNKLTMRQQLAYFIRNSGNRAALDCICPLSK